jgi:hypothetical protein
MPQEVQANSPLYAPGTLLGWYLTLLAILVAWTWHPKRSVSDSLDADLLIALTLPVVAFGHLIVLVNRYNEAADNDIVTASQAMEAPFTVTEAFMLYSVPLFLVGAIWKHAKRAIFIATVGIICYGVEWYIHLFACPSNLERIFSRSFLADSLAALCVTAVFLGASIYAAAFFTTMYFTRKAARKSERGDRAEQTILNDGFAESREARVFTVLSLLFLPISLAASLVGINLDYFGSHESRRHDAGSGPWHDVLPVMFPPSQTPMSDLDQVVAVLGGATILGFNLITAAVDNYKLTKARKARAREVRRRNDIRLRRILVQYDGVDRD